MSKRLGECYARMKTLGMNYQVSSKGTRLSCHQYTNLAPCLRMELPYPVKSAIRSAIAKIPSPLLY